MVEKYTWVVVCGYLLITIFSYISYYFAWVGSSSKDDTNIVLTITTMKRKCNLSNATYAFKYHVTLFFSISHCPLFNAFIHVCCSLNHKSLLNVFANRLPYVNWFQTLLTTCQKFFIVFIVIDALRPQYTHM